MQKISFGDKEYIKASEVAKRFKYTQDYVGQLCRNKKVEARLVGRTWYVVPESVTSYRKTKHKSSKASKPVVQRTRERSKVQVTVVPVMRGKTAKSLSNAAKPTHPNSIVTSYSDDTTAHIPIVTLKSQADTNISKQKARATINSVTHRNAPKKIKVVPFSKKNTVLVTEKIPEITLSSKLKVQETVEQVIEETDEEKSLFVTPRVQTTTQSPLPSKDVVISPHTPVSNTKTIKIQADKDDNSAQNVSKNRSWLPLVIVVAGLLSSIAVLGLTATYQVQAGVVGNSLEFSLEHVFKMIAVLTQ